MAAVHRQLRSGRVAFVLIRICTWISRQPPLRSWTWLHHKKREFDTEFIGIPCIRKYCQLFTHESNAFLSVIRRIETNACRDAKNATNHARNRPSPWGTWTSIQHMNAWAHPTHHAKRQLDRCTHFYTTTQQSPHWLQWDAANSSPKCSFPVDDQYFSGQILCVTIGLIQTFQNDDFSPSR